MIFKTQKNILKCITGFIGILYITLSCNPKASKNTENESTEKTQLNIIGYNLALPTKSFELPNKLKEISGLSYYKNNELACVNDEKGNVYFYNLIEENITNKLDFGKDGDYEGIEIVGKEIFVLKSNGKIKGINIDTKIERNIDCTSEEVAEYEGLGYNQKTNSLVLAAKELNNKATETKNIYQFNLSGNSFKKMIEIPLQDIKNDENGTNFMSSGLAIHPQTGQIFIISSVGKKLLILNPDGSKAALIALDPNIFSQPEGICFSPEGVLYISSEGKSGSGYIFKFEKQ